MSSQHVPKSISELVDEVQPAHPNFWAAVVGTRGGEKKVVFGPALGVTREEAFQKLITKVEDGDGAGWDGAGGGEMRGDLGSENMGCREEESDGYGGVDGDRGRGEDESDDEGKDDDKKSVGTERTAGASFAQNNNKRSRDGTDEAEDHTVTKKPKLHNTSNSGTAEASASDESIQQPVRAEPPELAASAPGKSAWWRMGWGDKKQGNMC